MKKIYHIALVALATTVFSAPSFAADANSPAKPVKKTRFQAADANGDGGVDLKEFLANPQARFTKLDVNKDGKLSAEEMQNKRKRPRRK